MVDTITLADKLAMIREQWSPKIIAELNDSHVKLARLQGEFVWHAHEEEDELFLVLRGTLRILLRDGEITLREGEMAVIPRGVEHLPIAEQEVHVMLIEPKGTLNTGNVRNDRTVERLERI